MALENRKIYSLDSEYMGRNLESVLKAGLQDATMLLLVLRTPIASHLDCFQLLADLEPWFLFERRDLRWPGTQVFPSQESEENHRSISQRYYQFNPTVAEILVNQHRCIWDWRQPDWPEDLCLLRPDGTPWFVSIVHEKDTYLKLGDSEYDMLSPELSTDRLSCEGPDPDPSETYPSNSGESM